MPVVNSSTAVNWNPWPTWTSTAINTPTSYALTSVTSGTQIWTVTNTTSNLIYDYWTRNHDIRAAVRRSEPPQRAFNAKVSEAEAQLRLREQEAYRAREAAAKAAREKAALLLEENLTEEQVEHLRARDCFYLETLGRDGTKNRYRIDRGTHGNVKRVDDKGSILESLCIQPGGVPTEDAMLAQKLWLETDEATFRKVANITRHQ